jgi:hypothetical protein
MRALLNSCSLIGPPTKHILRVVEYNRKSDIGEYRFRKPNLEIVIAIIY